jgi:hypothetical protein
LAAKFPGKIGDELINFISPAVRARQVVEAMATSSSTPTVDISRAKGRRGVESLISQISAHFNRHQGEFRNPQRPWRVHFAGEAAIDAGGPSRELVSDIASSIFAPASGLMVRVGTDNLFVPFGAATPERMRQYWAIGFYIAIVVRTSLVQDLPFPAIVWKAIAGRRVGPNDVIDADPELIRSEAPTWTCTNWEGTLVALPGRERD